MTKSDSLGGDSNGVTRVCWIPLFFITDPLKQNPIKNSKNDIKIPNIIPRIRKTNGTKVCGYPKLVWNKKIISV